MARASAEEARDKNAKIEEQLAQAEAARKSTEETLGQIRVGHQELTQKLAESEKARASAEGIREKFAKIGEQTR